MEFPAALGAMSADEIFRTYSRLIGIGGIATAGIIGIIKSSKVIGSAVKLAVGELARRVEEKKWKLSVLIKISL